MSRKSFQVTVKIRSLNLWDQDNRERSWVQTRVSELRKTWWLCVVRNVIEQSAAHVPQTPTSCDNPSHVAVGLANYLEKLSRRTLRFWGCQGRRNPRLKNDVFINNCWGTKSLHPGRSIVVCLFPTCQLSIRITTTQPILRQELKS